MHCGMCLPTCPTYDATKRERHSPRGRIALMRAVADGELDIGPEFAAEMSYCLGCLACETACPAGVQYADLLEHARHAIERNGINTGAARRCWRAVTLGLLFVHPRLLRAAGLLLRWYQRSGMQAWLRRVGLTALLPKGLRELEPLTPPVAPAFSNRLIRSEEAPRHGAARHTVALLTGCVQDMLFPDINRDTADVLLANACAVHTPPTQPCCGSLHAHNGELERARALARRMIDQLPAERYDAIITNSAGCGAHLRRYGSLLAEDARYAQVARVWADKVRDIHEWLVESDCRRPGASPFDEAVQVTYHDPCHLAHGQKITQQPREVCRLLPGVSLVELHESTWCCGSAGVYTITQPAQSDASLARKIRNVLATGADLVATANPGCHLQIERGLQQAGSGMAAIHPVSLLARAYRRERDRGIEGSRDRGI
ncbi:MAG: 4Fe-4S dicluster domain-containing protein [Luteitalea sp.]|nr:4Fe-4S dicluster domain-containing protein [Luteitalea sp.]